MNPENRAQGANPTQAPRCEFWVTDSPDAGGCDGRAVWRTPVQTRCTCEGKLEVFTCDEHHTTLAFLRTLGMRSRCLACNALATFEQESVRL